MAKTVVEELIYEGARCLVIGYSIPRPASFSCLSSGERAVIDLWLEGSTMQDIAGVRGTSKRTIANQIASVYRKLGVGSRGELLAIVHGSTKHEE